MSSKKCNTNERLFFCIKSNRGMLQRSPMFPVWTDNLLYVKLYAKRGTAQGQIKRYRERWPGVNWTDVAELKLTYIGTIDEITEIELLKE